MGKKLVIVESPAKAKTIGKILGNDYIVKFSMGHIRDLPLKSLGVDIEKSFNPKYVNVKGRKKIIEDLKNTAKSCDTIYLAPDPDREGEAIAWHLKTLLEKKNEKKEFLRVQYNEVTPRAIRNAFDNTCQLDYNRINAQQARRILDRIVGYKVSPLLWRNLKTGLSAGRVQSVALRLICEKEEEIKKFIPEEYWIIGAIVRKLVVPLDPFKIKLVRIDGKKAEIKNAEQSESIHKDLEKRTLKVEKIIIKEITKKPSPPYITSSLQQAGSSYLNFSPKRTMTIAQRLYEGIDLGSGSTGLITYMRTDSFSIAREALDSCRNMIKESFGTEYCPETPNFYKNRGNAQEAHEAIRPTDVNRTPESLNEKLDSDVLKIYTLIWRKFVASQMTPAKIKQRTVKINALPSPEQKTTYILQASASEIKFPGYMKVSGSSIIDKKNNKEGENEEVEDLPDLIEGEVLACLKLLKERKETQPPTRFSEASLVRALESNGVGRPSTYAQIVSTLYQRKYTEREKRSLVPTELGYKVNEFLVKSLSDLFNIKFTANMEESLDKIEKGSIEWTDMLRSFYDQFDKWIESTRPPPADINKVKTVLTVLDNIKEWDPEVKRGKRTYSDKKFVESIRKQAEKEKKNISQRQMEALIKIACRYKDQDPAIELLIKDGGYTKMLEIIETKKPKKSTKIKLTLLNKLSLDDGTRKFVDSLNTRIEGGLSLSEAQTRALNNIILSHSNQIENFNEIQKELHLDSIKIIEDNESKPLIDALSGIKKWKSPVKRGRRTFDDKEFFTSLSRYFTQRGFLSDKQRQALKKMVERYRDQIPNYVDLMQRGRSDK